MIALALKIFFALFILYLVVSYFYDITWFYPFILKYAVESLIAFIFLGGGIIAIVKTFAFKNVKVFFDQVFYNYNKNKLKEHIAFDMLRNAKIKNRNYNSSNLLIVQLTRKMILKEYRLAYRFLTNSLDYIEKTNHKNFYSSKDVAKIFEKDLKLERQMLYASLEVIFLNMKLEKVQALKEFYEAKIEHFLNPIYLQFYLLKENDYSIYKSIELILSQFWIVYLSIDSQIIHIFNLIEKDIPNAKMKIDSIDTESMEVIRNGF
jgi:hypothetical protein